jgi:hypothetical protein
MKPLGLVPAMQNNQPSQTAMCGAVEVSFFTGIFVWAGQ